MSVKRYSWDWECSSIIMREMPNGSYVTYEDYARLREQRDGLREALNDAVSGLRYIQEVHGNLYGVGFDRVFDKATAALSAARDGTG